MVAVMVKWWEVIGSDKNVVRDWNHWWSFMKWEEEKERGESSGVRFWSWVIEQLVENISLYWNRKTTERTVLWNVGGVKSVYVRG